jgi:hypothetical protein
MHLVQILGGAGVEGARKVGVEMRLAEHKAICNECGWKEETLKLECATRAG